jgi:hypothetical protein
LVSMKNVFGSGHLLELQRSHEQIGEVAA